MVNFVIITIILFGLNLIRF